MDAASGIDQYNSHHVPFPPVSSSVNPLMGIATHGSHAAQLLAAGFGGFNNTAAQFIPFNFMASGNANSCRVSSPTTTIFDLDQQPSLKPSNSQTLNKNEVTENADNKSSNSPPQLQLMDLGNGGNVEDKRKNSDSILPSMLLNAINTRGENRDQLV